MLHQTILRNSRISYLYDLQGIVFLDVILGQKPDLNPGSFIIDLAKGYHTFIYEAYLFAIRIADCFLVNQYLFVLIKRKSYYSNSFYTDISLVRCFTLIGIEVQS